MTDLSQRIEKLSPAKRALLQSRLKKQQTTSLAPDSAIDLTPTGLQRGPLSFGQQRMWLVDQIDHSHYTYNILRAYRIAGKLDVKLLQRSLDLVVQQHESLRTVYATEADQAVQIIKATMPAPLTFVDLETLTPQERQTRKNGILDQQAHQPFDLGTGPVLRCTLLRYAEEHHELILTVHHIAFDGWSIGLFARQLADNYHALTNGQTQPPLPLQYLDYATWQRQRCTDKFLEKQLAYWKTQLADLSDFELAGDRPRPPTPSLRGGSVKHTLSRELSDGLVQLGRQHRTSLFMTLLAGFKVLLHRYSGSDDIIVGSEVAGRDRVETESLIGFFVNTLVLRSDISGDPTFAQVLQRVRTVCLDAFANQDVPFDRLVQMLGPKRDLSRTPLAQIGFQLRNFPRHDPAAGPVTIEQVDVDQVIAIDDLGLMVSQRPSGLELQWQFSLDLFDAQTIQRMSKHMAILLEAIVDDPHKPISQLNLLPASERELVIQKWNDTQVAFPHDSCVHELIEQQAENSPDAVAVEIDRQRLTYNQFNSRANQLAHYLRRRGVKPDTPVGICCDRSLDLAVALLGILKAGGAYLPLDPDYPTDRLAYMIQDSNTSLVLTQQHTLKNIPLNGAAALCLDSDWSAIAQEVEHNPKPLATPENLAYIIYTSGSTGKPKGVAVEHRAVVNHNTAIAGAYDMHPDDRVLQFATISFDLSVEEIFVTWITGATLVFRSQRTPLEAVALSQWCEEQQITFFHPPTAFWHLWVQQLAQAKHTLPRSLRVLVIGGEKAAADVYKTWFTVGGDRIKWYNSYGPTETTVTSTIFKPPLDVDPAQIDGDLPIGRPIANTQVYILDHHLQPCPIGVAGELHIGGAGLARGYLNEPELTAQRFIANPFDPRPGQRLYKTGDLCRWRSDGQLMFLGRLDHQVKIRGFRIEPGEIEAALGEHPQVEQCMVTTFTQDSDTKLIAYLTVKQESPNNHAATVSTEPFRRHLAERLPSHMVPAAFIVLDDMPLTGSGKLDRKALPLPTSLQRQAPTQYIAPTTPTQEKLAAMLAKVLGIDRVGVDDNFFELGGHSLRAVVFISRIRDLFKLDLPLRKLFESPTIGELARWIDSQQENRAAASPHTIAQVSRNEPLALSFAQQRLWFLDRLEPGQANYNIPIVHRLDGPLDVGALERSLGTIVERHEVLRTSFVVQDGEPFQIIAPPTPFSLRICDLGDLSPSGREAKAQALASAQAQQPFNLEQGPLIRIELLKLSEVEHVLIVIMHHAVSDGWSVELFMGELSQLYRAYAADAPSPLAALPIQYADYAAWQHRQLQGQMLDTQLRYWSEQLEQLPNLELPTDHPRPAVQTYRGKRQSLVLPRSLADKLVKLNRSQGTTLFMSMLAGFMLLIHRYSGQSDIAVGCPVAGRNRSQLEPLIGFFINSIVMRNQLHSELSFRDLLHKVRETALGAFAHQELPFEKLVEHLHPQRDLSRNPLFQVFFNLINISQQALELPAIQATRLDIANDTTKFDLTLYIYEAPGQLTAAINYNADLFEDATIRCMLDHFQHLMDAAATEPNQPIASLPLLSPPERHKLLVQTNSIAPTTPFTTFQEADTNQSIPERFARQVGKHPDRIAIKTSEHEWTYSQLDAQVKRIARHILASAGDDTSPNQRIALLLDHDAPMLAATLGTLKAARVYVPLEPTHPTPHLLGIVQDVQPSAIVTNSQHLDRATALGRQACSDHPINIINIENLDNSLARQALPAVPPEGQAYILYTSGTTGRPKGVMQSHGNVLKHIAVYTNALHISGDDRLTLFSSYAYDAAVMDIFAALLNGATLLPIDVRRMGPADIADWITQHEATILHATPTVYRWFMGDLSEQTKLHTLRLVVMGGEEALRSDVELYRQHCPSTCLFVNGMGMTESTLALQYWLDHKTPLVGPAVPVGYAVAGSQVQLLDEAGHPTEVYGQIAITSDNLALGYWNQHDLSESAFQTVTPGNGQRQQRTYHTGDIGRRLADGSILYMGRIDRQIKIRGVRIELSEIEWALQQHPDVQEAVVSGRKHTPGEDALFAYFVCANQHCPTPQQLAAFMRERLPRHMVPNSYTKLTCLPKLPNGKVDYRALPKPEETSARALGEHLSPRTHTQQRLVEIWKRALRITNIGITDNFFDLGGHSLLAVNIFTEMGKQFGQTLPLATLFTSPTIQQLAASLDAAITKQHDTEPGVVVLQEAGSRPAIFCLPGIGGTVFCYRELSQRLGADQPFYGLQFPGLDGNEAPVNRVEDLASLLIAKMRRVQPHGPYYLGGYSFGGQVAYEMARQLAAQNECVAMLMLFDTMAPKALRKLPRRRRLNMHIDRLGQHNMVGKLRYLYKQTKSRLERMRQRHRYAPAIDPHNTGSGVTEVLRRVHKASAHALRHNQPQVYHGDITLFKSDGQPDWMEFCEDQPLNGWDKLVRGNIDLQHISGKHLEIFRQPHIDVLADRLQDCLCKTQVDLADADMGPASLG